MPSTLILLNCPVAADVPPCIPGRRLAEGKVGARDREQPGHRSRHRRGILRARGASLIITSEPAEKGNLEEVPFKVTVCSAKHHMLHPCCAQQSVLLIKATVQGSMGCHHPCGAAPQDDGASACMFLEVPSAQHSPNTGNFHRGLQVAKVCHDKGAAKVEQIIADLTQRQDTNRVAEVLHTHSLLLHPSHHTLPTAHPLLGS